MTIDTSATLGGASAQAALIDGISAVIAKATGAPADHVHINLRTGATMTWGSKLGGVGGNPHTTQVRITVTEKYPDATKLQIVAEAGPLLAPCSPPATTQYYFEQTNLSNLAIDGALLGTTAAKKEKAEKPKKEEKAKKDAPKKEEKAAPSEADKEKKAAEKKLAKVVKEGGKKGVEIEGARDMAGLDFFCTTMDEPDGDLDLLVTAMKAANAEPEEGSEERKGCSGPIGKMFFSAGAKQLAMVAYVPSGDVGKVEAGKVNSQPWMEAVIGHAEFAGRGKVVAAAAPAESPSGGEVVTAVVASDGDAGKFALKDKDVAMAAAQTFLRERGAFPEDTGDSDDDEVAFGDDAFDEINGW